ncbi:uncharacterized protein LOC126744205 [Anthonomus grandis grandis]|uniref:uncharacterized protein LOC126744205 n=1 Tax=Anthonomus grandis grandis TaxID=2921223 RepID=UPI0021663276|nr:uncharacterized protein LOC126744205 [Anthonomus grandis grandis]
MHEAIPETQRHSITLRYLASGMDLEDLKFMCAIAPQTLELIIMETCSAIIEALKDNIQIPKTKEGWTQIAQEFEEKWNFHNCVGSVDGKHILIQKLSNSGSYYYNYKGSFNIVLVNGDCKCKLLFHDDRCRSKWPSVRWWSVEEYVILAQVV